MSEPFIGQISLFGFNFAPRGWAHCNGQILQISQNTALFSLLGTTYGGDGRTTFGLPDLRGRVPIHPGQGTGLSNYAWGQRGGAENIPLNVQQMPAHNHVATTTIHGFSGPGNDRSPEDHAWAESDDRDYTDQAPDVDLGSASAQTTIQATGGGQAHENRQPYLALYFGIALQGVYPSRN
jgi:microcystin-dependent protein